MRFPTSTTANPGVTPLAALSASTSSLISPRIASAMALPVFFEWGVGGVLGLGCGGFFDWSVGRSVRRTSWLGKGVTDRLEFNHSSAVPCVPHWQPRTWCIHNTTNINPLPRTVDDVVSHDAGARKQGLLDVDGLEAPRLLLLREEKTRAGEEARGCQ